jgi:hypothetical protein
VDRFWSISSNLKAARGGAGGGSYQGKQRLGIPNEAGGEGGGSFETSEGHSGPPRGLKHGFGQKGSPKYLRGSRAGSCPSNLQVSIDSEPP